MSPQSEEGPPQVVDEPTPEQAPQRSEQAPQQSPARATRASEPGVPVWGRAVLVAAGALVVLVLALLVGGGGPQPAAPGLADPGPVTGWGLPIATTLMYLAEVMTVGSLLFGVIAPARKGRLEPVALRAVRTAAIFAWAWAALAVVTLTFTMSDILGTPPLRTDYRGSLTSFVTQTDDGRSLAVTIVLAVILAAVARSVRRLDGTALALLLGIATVVPLGLTGHSANSANHDIGASSLLVHLIAVVLWVGGLCSLVWYGRASTNALRVAAPRFSAMAVWCFVAAGGSGVVNAWLQLGAIDELWRSRYGWLVVGKVCALALLGWLGWRHRGRTLPKLERREPPAFLRFASGEAFVMAATVGLGVALAKTPPPIPQNIAQNGGAAALIGYPVPPISVGNLATLWRPDVIVLALAALALGLYLSGVRRLHQRGIHWPIGRTIAWIGGVALGLLVTVTGVATYAPAMFSVHMVQHMTLTMVVPILLAMSAPITLALRVLPARPGERDGGDSESGVGADRGARAWILRILHSRVMRILTYPVVPLALYIVTLYAFYFSPLFTVAMSSHLWHLAMLGHFLLVGSLYFWPIIALDPLPRKLPPLGRLLLLFASMPFHAFFGVIVMMMPTVIGATWYHALRLPWVDPITDQHTGGGIAWATAELPSLVVLVVVFVAWQRSEARAGRRADRHGAAELEAYNAMLARMAAHDRRTPGG